MNKLVYMLFLSIFFLDYLSEEVGILPRQMTWIPELLSGTVLLISLLHVAKSKVLFVHPKYVLLFFIFCLHLVAGAILNSVDPGTAFAAIRYYFKYTPLFILPFVYEFSDDEIKGQLKFLLTIFLIQFPVTIYQKFFLVLPPDLVSGTMGVTPVLSFILISGIAVLLAFYLRNKIATKYFLPLVFFLFVPTTINETKATLIYFPVAFLIVIYLSGVWKKNIHKVVGVGLVAVVMFSAFSIIYNVYFTRVSGDEGVINFFTDLTNKGGAGRYFYKGNAEDVDVKSLLKDKETLVGVNSLNTLQRHQLRRVDSIILPFRALSERPSQLLLGLGLGSVQESFIDRFSGKYKKIRMISPSDTLIVDLVWEIGLIGLGIYLLFSYFIFRDASRGAFVDSFQGNFSLGWSAVVILFLVSFPYVSFLSMNAMGFLFFYFSGYVAFNSYRKN